MKVNAVSIFILSTIICCLSVSAQRSAVLIFNESTWNFGNITEEGGAVEHEFVFRNNLGKGIKLANVETSCGCTSPVWTRDVVPIGGTGRIVVRFDPKGRPGFFSKTISVTTDPSTGIYQLNIRGNVGEKKTDTNEDLDHIQGNLRSASSVLACGKVFLNKEAILKSFTVQNSGTKPLRFLKSSAPPHIRITMPPTLKSGERGVLTMRYDGGKRGTYGLATDQVTLSTSDEIEPEKYFQVMANLEEFFEPVPVDRLQDVPRLILSNASLNLGDLITGASAESQLILTNTGKQDLYIRAAVPNCTCLTIDGFSEKIPAGSQLTITIRFTSGERTGRQLKSIMLYSNDPIKPVQRITVSAQLP